MDSRITRAWRRLFAGKPAVTEKPEVGEITQQQREVPAGEVITALMVGPLNVQPGTYKTYRKMRRHPTIALARAVAVAPVLNVEHSYEGDDEQVVEFVRSTLEPLWDGLVRHCLFALDYGWQPFERVWEVRDGRLTYAKLKPLLQDVTTLLTDEHGNVVGLKQGDVELTGAKALAFVHEGEPGELYGRSRHENVRGVWSAWEELLDRARRYAKRAVGTTPLIEYPEGRSLDRNGAEVENYKLAERILQRLGEGAGVAMPNTLSRHAVELARQGIDVRELRAWHLDFLEPKGRYGYEFVALLKHLETQMFRGWLVPERAAAEGQYGTKAEAEAHANVALEVTAQLERDILSWVNREVIAPLLELNWGPQAKGAVRLRSAGIEAGTREFYRVLVRALLGSPNVDLFLEHVDLRALLERLDIPMVEAVQASEEASVTLQTIYEELEVGRKAENAGTAESAGAATGR